MAPKPGWTTTEFWLTLLTNIVAGLTLLHPGFHLPAGAHVTESWAIVAAGLANGAYSFSRGKVKASAVVNTAGADLTDLATVAANVAELNTTLHTLAAGATPPAGGTLP